MAPGGGSGLSLARFSSGKLRTTKPLDQEKKRLEKTIQYRRYNVDLKREKKKRIEDAAKPNRPTFYDKVSCNLGLVGIELMYDCSFFNKVTSLSRLNPLKKKNRKNERKKRIVRIVFLKRKRNKKR